MKDAYIEVFQRDDNLWDYKLIAPNGQEMCGSLQGFTTEHDAHRGADMAVIYMSRRPEVREA